MKKHLLVLVAAALLAGCQKESNLSTPETQLTVVENNGIARVTEEIANDEFQNAVAPSYFSWRPGGKETGDVTDFLKMFLGKHPVCGATVTLTPLSPAGMKRVIDYGTGQTCKDGRTRSGKITITFEPQGTAKDMKQTVTFENFKTEDRTLNGTQTVERIYNATTGVGLMTRSTTIKITTADGKTISFTADRTRVIDGKGTPNDRSDDEIKVTGSSSAVSSDGTSWSSKITTTLLIKAACKSPHPVAGVEEITAKDGTKSVVNFGDGTCDNTYTVTTNSTTTTKTFIK